MTERVLGRTGSSRRRRFLFVPVLLVAGLALFWIGGAQAVHTDGLLELDNNAVNDSGTTGIDWADVYAAVQANADTKCDAASGVQALGAEECAWIHDPDGTSIFTTGGSKDDLDINNWQHTGGSVPDKDEIADAFAALFVSGGDEILYIGADREANNGSSDFGFWFFQNEVIANANGTFTDADGNPAHHTPGDILLLGTFTQGGAATNIRAFEWVGTGGNINGVLNDPGITLSDCDLVSTGDSGCGTVNGAIADPGATSPWSYTTKFSDPSSVNPHKSQSKDGIFASGTLYEGGINLSDFNLEGCFSSFMAETRSSPEIGAQLKDFVLGSFESCESGITTTPSQDSITLGGSVTDGATVTGTGPNAPNPTGTVDFFICGPTAVSSTQLCDGTTGNVGTAVSTETLNGTSNPSTVTSDPVQPSAVGRYCFRAEYSGDGTYDPAVHFGEITQADPNGTECFIVNTIPTSISTAQRWLPNDTATISTTGPSGYNLTGKVTFSLYLNSTTCSGTASYSEEINVPANAGLSEDISTTNGDGLGTGLAADFVVNAGNVGAGNFSWLVVYTPAASDTAHTGSTSICDDEHSSLTINNDSKP